MSHRTRFPRARLVAATLSFTAAAVAAIALSFQLYELGFVPQVGFGIVTFCAFFAVYAAILHRAPLGFAAAGVAVLLGTAIWALSTATIVSALGAAVAIGGIFAGAGAEFEFTFATVARASPEAAQTAAEEVAAETE